VLARVKQAKDLAYVESTIDKEIASIATKGVDEKTLGEVLSHARYAFAAQLSTPDHVALVGAEFLALAGRLSAIDEYFARLGQVKSADVKRVARTYFTPQNRTVVTLQPEAP
jgi:predicted Zn-dependent peptidase